MLQKHRSEISPFDLETTPLHSEYSPTSQHSFFFFLTTTRCVFPCGRTCVCMVGRCATWCDSDSATLCYSVPLDPTAVGFGSWYEPPKEIPLDPATLIPY